MSITPLCPVYSQCGGCQYQHVSYADELADKARKLKDLLKPLNLSDDVFADVLPSPVEYNYRNRLDLKLHRTKQGEILIGFSPLGRKGIIPIDNCPIARTEINEHIETVKREAKEKLTPKYRQASLVVRSGEGKNPAWGGIGRKSLTLEPANYFWVDITGRRIFYSLDTFFQANLFILPKAIEVMRSLSIWSKDAVFFDLYGGVGLFGIAFADLVKRVALIEEVEASVTIARHNVAYNKLENFDTYAGRVEDVLPKLLERYAELPKIVMVDPPRAGLSKESVAFLNDLKGVKHLLYLSCGPESLSENLKDMAAIWKVQKVMPFDFFPKTRHLEALVLLQKP
jgi:tRNA/tmRNA/rRNA uracil-C5-methylase (TrmA/RlmC/RlmD family)